jgi:hypothetical protein
MVGIAVATATRAIRQAARHANITMIPESSRKFCVYSDSQILYLTVFVSKIKTIQGGLTCKITDYKYLWIQGGRAGVSVHSPPSL